VETPADGGEPGLSVGLLGPVELRRGGELVKLGAAKQRMILALLGLRSPEVVSTDSLIDALWAGRPPPSAANALRVYMSELRALAKGARGGGAEIVTQPPGYRLALAEDAVDLRRFERLWRRGRAALQDGDPAAGALALREAERIWRGQPLADLAYEDAFAADVARLEEMRLACMEDRVDADLAVGRHAALIPELSETVHRHPLRERACAQLMVALYRAGRQSDALALYRATRARLTDQLGIEPGPELVDLERRILQQDPALAPSPPAPPPPASRRRSRAILVVSRSSDDVEPLLALAGPLARDGDAEVVLVRVLTATSSGPDERVGELTRRLSRVRDRLRETGIEARVAAFASRSPGPDVLKLATREDVALILVDGSRELILGRAGLAAELVAEPPCDVALHVPGRPCEAGPIVVPFGGGDQDWAALELAAALAQPTSASLALAGARSAGDAPDASRLLAAASLILQRSTGVVAAPVLIDPGAEGVLAAAEGAQLLVLGLPDRSDGDRPLRSRGAIAAAAAPPVLVVGRGRRPGLLAPPDGMTRFAWSIGSASAKVGH
jgi:DNA-binding SARP family transcriptional activator